MTVLEVIQRSTEFLAERGVESPRLQVELMLAEVLKLPRLQLYMNFNRELTKEETDALRSMVKRRGQREPLQHILGSTSFCGLELAVNHHALVPRPETEHLAELAWQETNRLVGDGVTEPRILDFGTGTGCLAIAIAIKVPSARLTAIDVSVDALELARANAARHGVSERVSFLLSDGFSALTEREQVDLMVSNPPYIPTNEIDSLEPEVKNHDPRAALDGGADGLDFYRLLAREAGRFLKSSVRLMMEIGDGQDEAVRNIFVEQKWIVRSVSEDYSGRKRLVVVSKEH